MPMSLLGCAENVSAHLVNGMRWLDGSSWSGCSIVVNERFSKRQTLTKAFFVA